MAVLDLSVTVSDTDYPRLMAAAQGALGKVPDGEGGQRDLTDAEVIEGIRQHGIGLMKQMVRDYERRIAIMQAEALDPQIEVI